MLGKQVQVGTSWVTIVGVTEQGFHGLQVGSPIDVTIPMMLAGRSVRSRQLWWFSVVGRIKPDASVEQARADLERLWDDYMLEIGKPPDKRGYFSGIALVPAARGLKRLRRQLSEPLLIAMAIVGGVLLVGCANLANLLLARASARRGEMSVRLAIGAGRGRLMRQLITEGTVLASCGAIVGLLVGRWGISLLMGLVYGDGGYFQLDPEFDTRVLAFTAAVTLLTAMLFSLAPALHATRIDAAKPLARTASSTGGARSVLRRSLVVTSGGALHRSSVRCSALRTHASESQRRPIRVPSRRGADGSDRSGDSRQDRRRWVRRKRAGIDATNTGGYQS